MRTYYHGSSLPNLEKLEPQVDSRLGVTGVFVSDEPFGPMLFSLLPERVKANVQYETKDNQFVSGTVRTPVINDEGWLYSVSVPVEQVHEIEEEKYVKGAVEVEEAKRVTLDGVKALGWNIVLTKEE